MDVPDIGVADRRDFQHVGTCVEARDVEFANIVACSQGFSAPLVERSAGNGAAAERPAWTVAVAEIVGRAKIQSVVEHFLPDQALVVSGIALPVRAVATAGIEDYLFEIIVVRETGF